MRLLQPYLVLLLLTCSAAITQADPLTYADSPEPLPFSDIADSPFRNAIVYLAADEYIGGFPDGTYRPEQQITRAEFIVVALRASTRTNSTPNGRSGTASLECLAGLDSNAWYASELCAAAEQRIIDGDGEGFRPDSLLTYSEALKVLLTAFDLVPDLTEAAGDRPWHEPYRQFADSNGLLPSGSYDPDGALTRELAANLLYRTLVMQHDPANLPTFDENAVLAAAISAAVLAGRAALLELHPQAAQPSTGCSAPTRPAPASLTVGGRERNIITHVPNAYDPNRPASLVIAFHGRTNSNAQVRNYMDLERFAPGAIVVYPGGIPLGSGSYSWSDSGDRADSLRDYALFDEIVSTFERNYCIDTDRIFVVGHSLGAWFANSLACARADVIRAAATLAGGIAASNCKSSVAALLLHNPRDVLVAISEGQQARDVFLDANQLLGTTPQPLPGRFNCSRYQTANSDAQIVVWCPHEIDYPFGNYYDPHSWPSGTGQLIMEFFSGLQ
jgi:polyhydroxybutyrate depolymerase